ncbi:hypothetical protein BJF86_01515 [Serinicoccus sp. CNJ-927]|nr:hypothetical protein BJF86_01515 [Serinicoccus sp. CNJ-927]
MIRMLEPRWWLSEVRRVVLVSPLGVLVVFLAVRFGVVEADGDRLNYDTVVIWFIAYLILYTGVTLVAFARSTRRQVHTWAQTEDRGTWAQRYLLGTAPGPGMSIFVGATALLVTVLWLPGELLTTSLGPAARTWLAVLLVVAAWTTVAVSFTVAYLVEDVQSDGAALGFPATPQEVDREFLDYVYLAVAVSSTFGTTDVDLRTPDVRRTATVHTLVAFVFNTVVLAVVVSLLA